MFKQELLCFKILLSRGVEPHICGQIIFFAEVQRQSDGERIVLWTGIFINPCAKRSLDSLFTPYTKINSKWIIHLQVKISGEKLEENLCELRLGKYFFCMITKAQFIKKRCNWTSSKLRTSGFLKILEEDEKGSPRLGGFSTPISNKGLEHIRNSLNL